MKYSVSCVIFTRSGKSKTLKLLQQIKSQTVLPKSLLLIENIKEEKNFSKCILEQILPGKLMQIQYRKVNFKNIAQSRELALNLVKTQITIFLDDDVLVSNDFINQIIIFFINRRDTCALVGKLFPTNNNLTSKYASMLYSQSHNITTSYPSVIDHYGMAAVALNVPKIRHLNIAFDTSLDTGEDVDFFLTLKEKGGKLFYNPSLQIYHDFEKNHIFKFVYRHYEYANNFLRIEEKHPNTYYFLHVFPQRKMHWLFLPFYIVYCSLREIKWKNLPFKFWFIAIAVHLAIVLGLYNSSKGRIIFLKNFKKSWLLI